MAKLKYNILANYLGQGWRALAGIIFIPVYVEILGIESYALIGIYGMIGAWLPILDASMSPTLNREMARYSAGSHTPQSIHDLLRSVEIVCLAASVVTGLGIWLAADFLAHHWFKVKVLSPSVVRDALSIIALVLALRFAENIYRGSLYGLQQQVWFNGFSMIFETLRHGGVILILWYVSNTIEAFFVWQAVISVFTVLVCRWRVLRLLDKPPSPARFSSEELSKVWKFAGGLSGVVLVGLLLTQSDKIILSKLIPLGQFSYYTLAVTVTGVLYMVSAPMSSAIYPRMIELHAQEAHTEFIRLYHQTSQLITVLVAPATMLLSFFGGGIVFMWSGNHDLANNTAPIISLFVIGTFMHTQFTLPYACQLAHGWTSLLFKLNLVTLCFLLPALFIIVPTYGTLGAAGIWAALHTANILIGIQLMHRRIYPTEKWRWYRDDVFLPSLGAFFVVWGARWLQPQGHQSRLHWFFFLLCVGVLATLLSALLSNQIRAKIFERLRRSRA
ncbi:MAG: oligosaccharide flippase family protein [Myxococcales bacterium]|nr:oligosaccharide flippase family protein [Myxococcales bacterium]